MRHYVKGSSPASFDAWKAQANEDWQPSYADLRSPEKGMLHQALLEEQNYLCCYCGRRVSLSDSHIEHFRPQELREDLALEYDNLLASCIRETKPGAPLHCGHQKGDAFDEAMYVSPLDPTCEARFSYLLTGDIKPRDAGAAYMIDLLRLDIGLLRNRRSEALNRVFDEQFIQSATAVELQALASAFRGPDPNGMCESFGHVLARFAEELQ